MVNLPLIDGKNTQLRDESFRRYNLEFHFVAGLGQPRISGGLTTQTGEGAGYYHAAYVARLTARRLPMRCQLKT